MVTVSELVTVVRAVTAVNLLLLGGLVVVWLRSYWQFRASHTLGLLAFGVVLLVQNGFALYLYNLSVPFQNWMGMAEVQAMTGMLGLSLLQLLALALLSYVTWQ
ncbi:MAG: hypothetical protein ABEI99_03385 [Halobaculum sp.]